MSVALISAPPLPATTVSPSATLITPVALHVAPPSLADRTIAALERRFTAIGHYPTAAMWTGLRALVGTLEDMAEGTAAPVVHLSSLDPGVGKTTAVIVLIHELLASPAHEDVSLLFGVARREQIEAIVKAAGLSRDDFAVLTSDKALNALGSEPSRARVLFTTHRMVESRCATRAFPDVAEFHYRGRPREVRIWDEAILPGRTVTVRRDSIAKLLDPLRPVRPALAAALEALFVELGTTADGTLLHIPDLAGRHGASLQDVLVALDKSPEAQAIAQALWLLLGKTVTVRSDGRRGNTILDYDETLPDGIQPLLVLDASARVRTVYDLWSDRRGGLMVLPFAAKRYDRHTVHLCRHGGGKSAFREDGIAMVDGIAETIRQKPGEEWLVVYHENCGIEVRPAIEDRLPAGIRVHFLNWGRHDATNEYAHVPNVVLAGTLFFPTSHYEALGRLAARHPSADGTFPPDDTAAVTLGETSNLVLQALCRGAVRRCADDGGCPETHSYIIASAKSGLAEALPRILPGARIVPWHPVVRKLPRQPAEALAYIKARLAEDPAALVPLREVEAHLGCRDRSNFNRTIRRHAGFVAALEAEGIIEHGRGRSAGFCTGQHLFDDD